MTWDWRKTAYAAAAVGGLTAAAGATFTLAAPSFFRDAELLTKVFYAAAFYKDTPVIDLLEQQSRVQPAKTFLIFESQAYTFKEADEWCNRVALFFHRLGVTKGDRVALIMKNEPAFLWLTFGLHKLGAVVTLINYNLRLHSLLHCIAIGQCKYLVAGKDAELLAAIGEIAHELGTAKVRLLAYAEGEAPPAFEKAIATDVAQLPGESLPSSARAKVNVDDKACHIFTSGTTGLPKAAIVTHKRLASGYITLGMVARLREDDILYTPLPLYHSAALMLVVNSIAKGSTVVLAPKFSAKSFWDDCRRHKVTVIQYIGELCRYLLAAPKRPDDGLHHVRMALGNGLRRDIWAEFKTRFKIPAIREWYAASEGIFAFFNLSGKEGSCGQLSTFLQSVTKVYGIRYDVDKDVIVRGPDGFCHLAAIGEPALYIALITERTPFVGYEGNQAQSERKILRNVFKEGDAYYNTGDLFVRDRDGHMFFADRVGDTYRWNGENVATLEVANVLLDHPAVSDAIVYGVSVPGHDGRAGMAAVCLQQGVTSTKEDVLRSLYEHVVGKLPSYAQPFFLRFLDKPPLTGTFKYSAVDLKKEGFDPATACTDVYLRSQAARTYVKVDAQLLARINEGILDDRHRRELPVMSRL